MKMQLRLTRPICPLQSPYLLAFCALPPTEPIAERTDRETQEDGVGVIADLLLFNSMGADHPARMENPHGRSRKRHHRRRFRLCRQVLEHPGPGLFPEGGLRFEVRVAA